MCVVSPDLVWIRHTPSRPPLSPRSLSSRERSRNGRGFRFVSIAIWYLFSVQYVSDNARSIQLPHNEWILPVYREIASHIKASRATDKGLSVTTMIWMFNFTDYRTCTRRRLNVRDNRRVWLFGCVVQYSTVFKWFATGCLHGEAGSSVLAIFPATFTRTIQVAHSAHTVHFVTHAISWAHGVQLNSRSLYCYSQL